MHLWGVAVDRASNLMQKNECPAQALTTATLVELNPRLLCGFSSPIRSMPKEVATPVLESPKVAGPFQESRKRQKVEQEKFCYDFQENGKCGPKNCLFIHQCRRCGAKDHGDVFKDCPLRDRR